MPHNGLPHGKKVSAFTTLLIPAAKDDEMTKFYNDLKAAEAAHAVAATIIQGNAIVPFLISEPVMHTTVTEGESKRESAAPSDQQKKKRKIDALPTGKKPSVQLEKWATKRQELKSETTESEVSEFADTTQLCCLLCKRKFQSIAEIQKHERLSKLHQVCPPPSC